MSNHLHLKEEEKKELHAFADSHEEPIKHTSKREKKCRKKRLCIFMFIEYIRSSIFLFFSVVVVVVKLKKKITGNTKYQ